MSVAVVGRNAIDDIHTGGYATRVVGMGRVDPRIDDVRVNACAGVRIRIALIEPIGGIDPIEPPGRGIALRVIDRHDLIALDVRHAWVAPQRFDRRVGQIGDREALDGVAVHEAARPTVTAHERVRCPVGVRFVGGEDDDVVAGNPGASSIGVGRRAGGGPWRRGVLAGSNSQRGAEGSGESLHGSS